jgi:hypothetical protein
MNRSFGSRRSSGARTSDHDDLPESSLDLVGELRSIPERLAHLRLVHVSHQDTSRDLLGPLVEGFLLFRVHKKPHLHITGFEQCIA